MGEGVAAHTQEEAEHTEGGESHGHISTDADALQFVVLILLILVFVAHFSSFIVCAAARFLF